MTEINKTNIPGQEERQSNSDVLPTSPQAAVVVGATALPGLRETLFGLGGERIDATATLITGLIGQRADDKGFPTANTQRFLETYSVAGVDPRALPERGLDRLSVETIDDAINSSNPIIALWSATCAKGAEDNYRFIYRNRQQEGVGRKERNNELFQAAPLVHGTTAVAFTKAMTTGMFVSNRSLEELGADVSGANDATIGMTTAEDRKLGLNNYVFFDFGRPRTSRSHDQPEITVVFRQAAMNQEGTFITENDILDCYDKNGYINFVKYLSGMTLPADFHESALDRLLATENATKSNPRSIGPRLEMADFLGGDNGDKTNVGTAAFEGWEVKIPQVPTGFIDRVIVRDEKTYQEFLELYGGEMPIVFEPDLSRFFRPDRESRERAYAVDIFGTHERARLLHEQKLDVDFERRRSKIEQAPPEEVREEWFIAKSTAVDETNPALASNAPPEILVFTPFKFEPNKYSDTEMALGVNAAVADSPLGRLFLEAGKCSVTRVRYIGDNPGDGIVLDARAILNTGEIKH